MLFLSFSSLHASKYIRSLRISLSNGLPSNCVNAIIQDDLGFIWLGTNYGLCRYDGYSTINFPRLSNDPKVKTDAHVAYLYLTNQKGLIEIVTMNGQHIYYDTHKNKFLTPDQTKAKPVHPKKITHNPYQAVTGADAIFHGQTKHYSLWSNGGDVWIIDRRGRIEKHHLLDNAQFTTNKKDKFYCVEDAMGNLLIATYGNGLFTRYPDGTMHHLTAQDRNPQVSSNFLNCIYLDRSGSLWIGSENAGANCIYTIHNLDVNYIFPHPEERGTRSNFINALEYDKGDYIIGTRKNELFRYNPTTRKMTLIDTKDAMITDLFFDREGHRFLATRGKGIYIDDVHYYDKSKEHYFPANNIYDIKQDQQGRLWIATWEQGVFVGRFDARTKKITGRFFLQRNVGESRTHYIDINKNGQVWIATLNGVYTLPPGRKLTSDKDFDNYNIDNSSLRSNEIMTVRSASDGDLLVASVGEGVARCTVKDGRISTINYLNKSNGMANDIALGIIEDRNGYCWVGSEDGISRIKNKELIQTFRFSSDIQENCFSVNTHFLTPDGHLLFGTHEGVLDISFKGAPHTDKKFRCHITDLRINGTSVLNHDDIELKTSLTLANEISLSHRQNSLEITFSDFDYARSMSTLYQYYMEGVDKHWHEPTSNNVATYSELNPGTYVFHLRKGNDPKSPEDILTIVIREPWYNTWWAWLFYLTLLGTATYFVYGIWKRNFHLQQEINMEKQLIDYRIDFFTNIAHEFRTPLSIIQHSTDKIKSMVKQGNKPSAQSIATLNRGTNRMMRLVNELLDFRTIQTNNVRLEVASGDIVKTLKDVCMDFWTMSRQKEQDLNFTPSIAKYVVVFDQHIVETVIYNLISNAIKYTPTGGNIQVKFTVVNNTNATTGEEGHAGKQIVITVEDSGPGITPQQQQYLFQPFMHGYMSQGGMGIGLSASKTLATTHHGNLTYSRSDLLGGSSFTFTLPAATSESNEYAPNDYKQESYQCATAETENDKAEYREDSLLRELVPQALNPQRVFIVEDDIDMQQLIEAEVGPFFQTSCYSNGKEAWDALSTLLKEEPDHLPALIITDAMLPEMDGYMLTRNVKTHNGLEHIPVVMLTALDDERHQVRAYESGVDDYLTKPCNFKVLIARVAQLITWSLQHTKTADQQQDTAAVHDKEARSKAPHQSNDGKEGAPSLLMSQQDKLFKERVEIIVAQNMGHADFSVDRIAEKMHMGRTKFYGKMKELTGMTPNKYLQVKRMERAAELLLDGSYNIYEIAEKVGIQDTSYFYKCFKSHFGIAPSKYGKS